MIAPYIPQELSSDECTFPFILKYFKGIMGAKKYKILCREHDFLRRYKVINWFKANLLLGKRIASDGIKGKIRAPIYVIATTISYPLFNNTQELPSRWKKYADYYQNAFR